MLLVPFVNIFMKTRIIDKLLLVIIRLILEDVCCLALLYKGGFMIFSVI